MRRNLKVFADKTPPKTSLSNMPDTLPQYRDLLNPVITALRDLGGSGTLDEINERVIDSLGLPADLAETLHDPETSNETELEYRLAWARTYLKKYGMIDNSTRGVWALTSKADGVINVDPREVLRAAQPTNATKQAQKKHNGFDDTQEDIYESNSDDWRKQLFIILTQSLTPQAFERLVQRLLRESGFVHVEVTGRTGDGGIDGKGIARIHGLMSFHVVFQAKKYQGTVSAAQVRDFRGAMVGRADKGLFITTGSFTKDAVREATRDGAPPIDLVDGDTLADKLKEFGLGIRVQMVETVRVDGQWFNQI